MNMQQVLGAEITPLDSEQAHQCVAWVIGAADTGPDAVADARWAVLQCDLSFVWAIRQVDHWILASDVAPEVRKPEVPALCEMRLFGKTAEALIWRRPSGLTGRLLRDSAVSISPDHAPIDQVAPFCSANDPQATEDLGDGFVIRTLPNGRAIVAPAGANLLVRQYLSEDLGLLRIAATRFVEVR
ncbi:MAG: hypothetical protein GX446_04155 [Chthonomonadales bacterium]|nr:hypothetical protein [Chthonomonadales bacterium]